MREEGGGGRGWGYLGGGDHKTCVVDEVKLGSLLTQGPM